MSNGLFDQTLRVHSWGNTLEEAFVQSAMAMCNYMYEQSAVEIDENLTHEFVVEGIEL